MSTAIQNMIKLSCTAVLLASTPALASQQATGTFQVTATVPMACWVDHSVQADALANAPGLVTEGCNNASGYMVSAQYRPLAATESARLVYGTNMVDLSALGADEVHREYGPRIQQIAYRFDQVSLDAPLTLSLTIQPI
ncbi:MULTISPECIES: hypothetical protein [unclassified Sphingopyxis]|jgi:hypothetical protein|uniref:hypothetical protein n=1 Tax=unclassified Sphingopyxis TaxID=2614943 RepID=UPI00285DE28C|nr:MULTISPECIES: hypothetical protein [unclassified Sphingopyxis]MDR6834399.1 hypothetical protein [Sphingopyxis sp. BE122]MDR7226668.1 hypothetical protein [Sphingopyxis sp. BE259]